MEQIALLQQIFLWSALVYWAAGFLLLWRIPVPGEISEGEGGRSGVGDMSVVVPARNEAVNIGVLLDSIAAQRSRPLEVIVVDDQSSDGTAEIADGFSGEGVRVIAAGERPEGWTGKNWSCHRGAEEAAGRLILFLDADTRLEGPESLVRLGAEHARCGGMVSVQPYHRVRRLYEQLSGFFNLIAMVGSGAFDFWSRPGEADGCFGPCILMDRAEYDAVGGHRAVGGQVVDDLALCALYRAKGLGVHCFGGRGLISFRMYPGGLRSLIEGWTKNMAMGASLSKLRSIVLLVIWFTGISNAALVLTLWLRFSAGTSVAASVAASAGASAGTGVLMVMVAYGIYVAQVFLQLRRVGSFSLLSALLFPVEFLFFVAVFVLSIIRTRVFGSVSWKGRSIKINQE